VNTVAQATSPSLLQALLSEQLLHGSTFLGLVLVLLGFLYLSYDLLGKPRGILNWLLILLTHLVICILVLAVLAPPIPRVVQRGGSKVEK
jgi:hypothetical protein